MNILYITTTDLDNSGSTKIHTFQIIKQFYKKNYNIDLFCMLKSSNSISQEYSNFLNRLIIIKRRKIQLLTDLHYELFLLLYLLLNQKKYKFIYLRLSSKFIFFSIFIKLIKIPFFIEVNGLLNLEVKSNTNINILLYKLISFKNKLIENSLAKNSKGIIVVTEKIKNYFINNYNIQNNKILHISNGVNLEDYNIIKQKKITKKEDKITIIYLGYFGYWYEIEILLHAIKKISAFTIECLLVGDGPKYQSCIDLCKYLNIEDKVIFIGRIDKKETYKYLELADLAILPLKKEDRNILTGVSPIKLYEYCAAYKPVLTSDLDELKFIPEFKLGFNYISGSSDDLANKLQIAIQDKIKLFKMGKNAREWVEKNATWDIIADKISNFINERPD